MKKLEFMPLPEQKNLLTRLPKEKLIDFLRQSVESNNRLSTKELEQSLWCLFQPEVEEVLSSHQGYKCYQAIQSQEASYTVFQRCGQDLAHAIQSYSEEIHQDEVAHKKLNIQVSKELFGFSCGLSSLIDNTRRLKNSFNLKGYDEIVSPPNLSPSLTKFFEVLRNSSCHYIFIEPQWNWERDFVSGTTKYTYCLSRNTFLKVVTSPSCNTSREKKEAAIKFASESPTDNLDILDMSQRLLAIQSEIQERLLRELDLQNPTNWKECKFVLKLNRRIHRLMQWKALLGNFVRWTNPPDPYNHLHKYLSAEQIAAVNLLPRGSEEQVNTIIYFADDEREMDEELYSLIHKYFGLFQNDAK